MTNNVNVLAPFGPRIAKLKIPKNLINKINKEIDKIVDNQNLSKRFDYSKELVGQVSQELQLPKTFINKYLKNSRNFLNKSIYNHMPKIGDMILFPNYLMHTAYPFQSGDERRSFSFNATIDEKIANVFKHE
ncbi:MAG: hypothetical protein EBW89_04610 [Candidatus Fonsibacter ubiquis]|nr:hypothetical protein [Candidatus Fonsibacter ubiquis]